MKIGIIGAGRVGRALGRGWLRAGHDLAFGVRDPIAATSQPDAPGAPAKYLSPIEAAAFGSVVVLAVPFDAVQAVLGELGNLTGKVLVDCTNPLAADLSHLTVGTDSSAGERVASWAPGVRVVKAFNTTGAANMLGPQYGSDALTLCLCGDDAEAKGVVARLASDLGFDPVDAGGIVSARLLEPFARLWVQLAQGQGLGPNIGWKLLRK